MFSMSIGQSKLYSLIGLLFLIAVINGQTGQTPVRHSNGHEVRSPSEPARIDPVPADSVPAQADSSRESANRTTHAGGENESEVPRSGASERIAKIKSAKELMERTKIFPFFHDDLSQLKSMEVTATGYFAGHESTGKNPGHPEYGITFSGVHVRRDIFSTVAADPKVFPLGTVLWIPGYGYAVVADTGSAIKGKKLDLFFETKEQVYKEWGKKQVNVLVVKPGNGKVTEETMVRLNNILSNPGDLKNLL